MDKPHVVILGAGPAGLGAASRLARRKSFQVTVLEKNSHVGGNAGSFSLAGIPVDYGSHRLHPACDPAILADIRSMLDGDLLDRPRHGRIRLRGRWIHFPLKPLDLGLRLTPNFALGVGLDMVGKVFRRNGHSRGSETFASIMEKGLGKTICRDFYFPYARKIWGLDPSELSVTQAKRRVSNNSMSKMIARVLSAIPGLKPKGSGRFFYPRYGYGQISEVYFRSAQEAGSEIHLDAHVNSVEIGEGGKHIVYYEKGGAIHSVQADHIWSTIPITVLARILKPSPPLDLLNAAQKIDFRAMILVYLVLNQDQFSEYDAHYFPEIEIPISRLSEPKNYSNSREPQDRTVLCAELPCSPDDPEWSYSDEDLGNQVQHALEIAGIPVKSQILQVLVRRLRFAYPIYRQGYEVLFSSLDDWLSRIDGLLTFGRQGLFAHDNTHHALYMAYSAAACLDDEGRFDQERWHEYRRIFETHVVED